MGNEPLRREMAREQERSMRKGLGAQGGAMEDSKLKIQEEIEKSPYDGYPQK
jgi:hypothetical protein